VSRLPGTSLGSLDGGAVRSCVSVVRQLLTSLIRIEVHLLIHQAGIPIDIAQQVLIRDQDHMFTQRKISVRVGGSALSNKLLLAVQTVKLGIIVSWLSLLDIVAHPLICSTGLVFC